MPFFKNLLKNRVFLILTLICLLSVTLNLYKKDAVPACLNADEAAFGYNTYSILKTGRDEYGTSLPLRLKSFGDYKLPVYSYLSVPLMAVGGLNETTTRALNTLLSITFPLSVFFFAKELFGNKKAALISAFLITVNIAVAMVGRQAHEGYLALILITLASLFFLKLVKKPTPKHSILFLATTLVSLFTYQSSRIFATFFLILSFFYLFKKKVGRWFLLGVITVVVLFGVTDLIYKPDRVTNLLLFNNQGFINKVQEYRSEGGNRFIYNKLTIGAKEVVARHLQYFSSQFLTVDGDSNYRFGYPGLSPITYIEFIFLFIGLYYLFKNKEKWRYFLLLLLFVSPISNSLTAIDLSTTRSLFIFVPILIISGYGFSQLRASRSIVTGILLLEFVLLFYSWNFYFNHYPKKPTVIRWQQCGYKELAQYVKTNYDKFDRFYITKRHGEPYIFLLYYLGYSPEKYHKQASLSGPDQYGFGQVEKFDKFIFELPNNFEDSNAAYVGYSIDQDNRFPPNSKKIKVGTEDIFTIYEKNM